MEESEGDDEEEDEEKERITLDTAWKIPSSVPFHFKLKKGHRVHPIAFD